MAYKVTESIRRTGTCKAHKLTHYLICLVHTQKTIWKNDKLSFYQGQCDGRFAGCLAITVSASLQLLYSWNKLRHENEMSINKL